MTPLESVTSGTEDWVEGPLSSTIVACNEGGRGWNLLLFKQPSRMSGAIRWRARVTHGRKIRSLRPELVKWIEFNTETGIAFAPVLIAPLGVFLGCLSKLVYIWEANCRREKEVRERERKRRKKWEEERKVDADIDRWALSRGMEGNKLVYFQVVRVGHLNVLSTSVSLGCNRYRLITRIVSEKPPICSLNLNWLIT